MTTLSFLNKALSRTVLTAFFATVFTGYAAAQVPSAQTGTAFPGRVEEQVKPPKEAPSVAPKMEIETARPQAPAGAEKITFQLKSVQIDGVTAYGEKDLAPLYTDMIGQTVTLADVYALSDALTRKFRNDGYILTQVVVPPQTIESGAIRLRVVEGFIDKVDVEGNDNPHALALIRAYAAQIANGQAVNVKTLERALLLINDLPGISARSVLSPSKTKTGAADLKILITRDPYEALVGVDNYGSRFLGPAQLTAAGSLNSAFGWNERLTAQMALAPQVGEGLEMAYFGVDWKQPFGKYGTTFDLQASNTNTEPGYTLKPFNVRGHSQYWAAEVEHPFIRTRALNVSGRAKFDWRDAESRNDVETTREDKIRALRLGGHLEFLDKIFGAGVNTADAEVSHGLDWFGAWDGINPNVTRPDAEAEFFKVNAELQRLQRLTPELNLLVATQGQWTNDGLLSSEEFGIGGINYGRGYDPSEVTGDKGIAAKAEIQFNPQYKLDYLKDYQIFGFYDVGKVWNEDATSSAQKIDSLASAGIGVRLSFPQEYEASALVAAPMTRTPQTEDETNPRFLFSLSKRF